MSARKEFTKKEISKLLSSYKKGANLRDLAADAGCSVTTVRSLLIANGATMRPRGKVAAKPAPKAKAATKEKAAAKPPKVAPKKGAKVTKPAPKKSVAKKGKTTKK